MRLYEKEEKKSDGCKLRQVLKRERERWGDRGREKEGEKERERGRKRDGTGEGDGEGERGEAQRKRKGSRGCEIRLAYEEVKANDVMTGGQVYVSRCGEVYVLRCRDVYVFKCGKRKTKGRKAG